MVHCSDEPGFFCRSLKTIQSSISVVISSMQLPTFYALVCFRMQQKTWKRTFFCKYVQTQPLFAPIAPRIPGWWHTGLPVTSGIKIHHILFFSCQWGWTVAAHLVPCVCLQGGFLLDDRWSSVLPFPLMFGLWIIPQLSVVVLGGFCSNLCFCHTAMKDSPLVLALRWGWLEGTGAPWETRGHTMSWASQL